MNETETRAAHIDPALKAAHLSVNQPVQVRADHDLEDLLARITPENRHSEADFGAPQGQEIL